MSDTKGEGETPRTDAVKRNWQLPDGSVEERVPIAFARELERENIELRARTKDWDALTSLLTKERDDACKENARLRQYCESARVALKQIVDLANVNETTRNILISLGNGFNDAARGSRP